MQQDYSKQALMNFLDYERDKGLVKENTISSRKAAVNAVLGILSEEELLDIREIDLDSVMSRFSILRGSDFSPDSLKVYKSRVASAIGDFIEYRRSPATFKSSVNVRAARASKSYDSGNTTRQRQTVKTENFDVDIGVAFPIPIREGIVVKLLGVPSDLTKREAQKISNIVMALAQNADDLDGD